MAKSVSAGLCGRCLPNDSLKVFVPGFDLACWEGKPGRAVHIAALRSAFTGTIYLIQKVGRDMRERGSGKILITGSIAGQPGPTDAEFFERADMMDTSVGQGSKDDPADVAQTGFDAMMRGDSDVVAGWKNKVQSARRAASKDGGAGFGRAVEVGGPLCHSRESGNPVNTRVAAEYWVPAFAGMTIRVPGRASRPRTVLGLALTHGVSLAARTVRFRTAPCNLMIMRYILSVRPHFTKAVSVAGEFAGWWVLALQPFG
jgi:hypothetical protein